METLQKSKSSLLRTGSEHETGVHVAEKLSERISAGEPVSPARVSLKAHKAHTNFGLKSTEAALLYQNTTAIQNRFARDFVDPLFPLKPVTYAPIKRFFDILVAVVMLLMAAPIMLTAALVIKLTSSGPMLFKQIRVGQGGRHFWCYKFRSMCIDAEDKKKLLMHLNEASGPVFKIKRDPRITPVGSIIRKFSIDELPQLFNVLKGDMSIVGPRPPIPSEVSHYTAYQRGRLAVRPGLTCLWQVNGRSNVSFERWVELDLLYIETMSFTNDVKIVLKTIPAVMKGSGAH
jgi:exopolysaccharide biosynthesis polyprenyl glycosylphosphotransferase